MKRVRIGWEQYRITRRKYEDEANCSLEIRPLLFAFLPVIPWKSMFIGSLDACIGAINIRGELHCKRKKEKIELYLPARDFKWLW